jgi:hypothetical protein
MPAGRVGLQPAYRQNAILSAAPESPFLTCGLSGRIAVSERSVAMDKVVFRLVYLHDHSYAAEIRMANGTIKAARGFKAEADAETWLVEQRSMAPAKAAWVRLPTLNWRTNRPRLNILTCRPPRHQ